MINSTSNIPKLRFPGFEGEWKEKRLGEILSIGSGKDYKHLNKGDVPVFGTGGYMLSVDKSLYDGESVFIGRKGTINKPFYYNGPFWTVDTLFFTHKYKGNIPKFIYLLFQKINWDKYNEASGVPSLSKSTIEKIKIKQPNFKEQQKIADFLCKIDKWIGNLKQQKENLEQYKKGTMQKIFSQEVRFKDENGKEFEEWKEYKLDELIDHIGGTALENYTTEKGPYHFISIGNYSTEGKYIDDGRRVVLNNKTQTKLLNKNDLVMILNDKTSSGDIIGSTILINENNKFIYNQRSERILCKENFLPLFAWFILNSKKFRKRIFTISQGGTQIYVNFPSVQKEKLLVPEIKEQQKIAKFLTSIDELIDSKQEQIVKAGEWKKGLMQRMFV